MLHAAGRNSSIYSSQSLNVYNWFDKITENTIKIVTVLVKFYCSCPESSDHIRHYVDPITGRATPI